MKLEDKMKQKTEIKLTNDKNTSPDLAHTQNH